MFRIEMYSQIRIEKTIEKKQTSCHVSTQTMISFQSKELFSQKSVKLVKNTDSKYDEYLRKVNESKMYDFDAKLRNKNHLTVDPSSLERELTLSTPPLNIHKKEIVRK